MIIITEKDIIDKLIPFLNKKDYKNLCLISYGTFYDVVNENDGGDVQNLWHFCFKDNKSYQNVLILKSLINNYNLNYFVGKNIGYVFLSILNISCNYRIMI